MNIRALGSPVVVVVRQQVQYEAVDQNSWDAVELNRLDEHRKSVGFRGLRESETYTVSKGVPMFNIPRTFDCASKVRPHASMDERVYIYHFRTHKPYLHTHGEIISAISQP